MWSRNRKASLKDTLKMHDPEKHAFHFQGPGGWRLSATGLGLFVVLVIAMVAWRYLT